ncbi:substrate-binding domain-containing protein, partial [Streptomyces sp. NPDC002215]|uniref:substrate-binding domain-containing protein n=1 Tax=Streptomyces sp. NPDC002215 TaxID=3154412 RepID=UPI003320E67A
LRIRRPTSHLDIPPWTIKIHCQGVHSKGSASYAALLLHALRDAGLTVPRDVAVVGADDLVTATLQDPPLTTIRLPLVPPALVADIIDAQVNGTDVPDAPAAEAVLVPRASS